MRGSILAERIHLTVTIGLDEITLGNKRGADIKLRNAVKTTDAEDRTSMML